jgi:hypothetical protein
VLVLTPRICRNGKCGRRPFKKRTADLAAAFEKIGETRGQNSEVNGIACATKGDMTPVGEKFCEILRQVTGTRSRITSIKSED